MMDQNGSIKKYNRGFLFIFIVLLALQGFTQSMHDAVGNEFSLSQCISYALSNQPLIKQSEIDEKIDIQNIRVALSAWYPQLNAGADYQHYLKLPVSFFPDLNNPSGPKNKVSTGLLNTSLIQFSATQSIYTTELFFAGKTSRDLRTQANQNLRNVRINTIVTVSKAFYDVLLTMKQLDVLDEDIQRLSRNYEDAYHLYQSGVTDKIDWQQAMISLNNVKAQRKNADESIRAKYSTLKQLMGFPETGQLKLYYDSASITRETLADTLEKPDYNNRIEYQLMKTGLKLQNEEVGYFRWSFLPSVSAFFNYNVLFQNDQFAQLYNLNFPYSWYGLKLSLPLFQGASRWQNLKKAHLEVKRMEEGSRYLESQIWSEYEQALASYKSNYYSLQVAGTNIAIAREIYNTVNLQYNQGIKPYLEVIVSETDLRTAQLNWLSALFQVLNSTLDLKKSLGEIN